jgi:hypothetical protein
MACVVQKNMQDCNENNMVDDNNVTDSERPSKQLQIPLHSSENDFRRYLEGSSAILNKAPMPPIRVTASGDAYVLPSDVIRLYFGFGIKPHMIRTEDDIVRNGSFVSTAWQSKKAKEALCSLETKDDSTYKILLADWSDGFDPNGTSKNNRGSVHAVTCSLFSENRLSTS